MGLFITRATWGAKGSLSGQEKFDPAKVKGVALHHTVTPSDRDHSACDNRVRGIEAAQRNKGYATIAYNYLVCEHGYVFEGRPLPYQSAANGGNSNADTKRNNAAWVAVAWIGDGTKGKLPTVKARQAIERVRLKVMAKYGYDTRETIPHSALHATACPGAPLRGWLKDDGHKF